MTTVDAVELRDIHVSNLAQREREVKTGDVNENNIHYTRIQQMRKSNEGLPPMCRTDICSSEIVTHQKGIFDWPETFVGENVTITCPQGGAEPGAVANRYCHYRYDALTRDFKAVWEQPMIQGCKSNITLQLVELKSTLITRKDYRHVMRRLSELLKESTLVSEDDMDLTADIFDILVEAMETIKVTNAQDIGEMIVQTTSHLSEVDVEILRNTSKNACARITQAVERYMEWLPFLEGRRNIRFSSKNMEVHTMRLEAGKARKDNDSANSNASADEAGFFHIGDETYTGDDLYTKFHWSSRVDPKAVNFMSVSISLPMESLFNALKDQTDTNGSQDRLTFIVHFQSNLFMAQDDIGAAPLPHSRSCNIVASTSLIVNGQTGFGLSEPLEVKFVKNNKVSNDLQNVTCGLRTTMLNETEKGGVCRTSNVTESLTVCTCTSLGDFYLSSPNDDDDSQFGVPSAAGAFEFLGFAYFEALSIYSSVGFGVSLVCLLVTIITYLYFGKLRSGRTSLILLNLCIALSLQMLSFLVFIPFVKNQDGCRVANILRVYLILVSLAWNGVEGLNMYLSLVRVFVKYTPKFVLKCGIVAWGLPILVVALPFCHRTTYYDGFYDTDFNCTFTCQLPRQTLYYVLFLPMSLIMVFNCFVFIMVVYILRTKWKNADGRSRTIDQLRGAITLLVLLGLAWIFSGFASINYRTVGKNLRTVQVMFQCLFVTCIAFQGLYIFVFHCARQPDVRSHVWSSFSISGSGSNTTRQEDITVVDSSPPHHSSLTTTQL
ncbi:adhesion G-protein coupled receptor G2-like isoform X2 [Ptychodera flava]